MKSLEFVNEYRNQTIKSMNDYIDNCDKYGQEINECYFNLLEEQFAHFEIIKQDLERYELILKRLYLTGIDNQIIYMIDIDGYSDEDRRDYFKLKDAVMDKLDEEFYREFFDPNTKNEDNE